MQLNTLEIIPGILKDYQILAEYHAETTLTGLCTQIYKIVGQGKHRKSFPDPIGVIVFRKPIPDIRSRTIATKGFFKHRQTTTGRLKLVNEKIEYLARIIIDPNFRRIGLATWLVKDVLERQIVPLVESMSPLDYTNKIFQHNGFRLYHNSAPRWYRTFTNALDQVGLSKLYLENPLHVQNRLDNISGSMKDFIDREIIRFINHFKSRQNMCPGINRTIFFLRKIKYPHAYLLWQNPRVELTSK